MFFFFFSSRRRHTRSLRDWSSDVCSSDLGRESSQAHVQRDEMHAHAAGANFFQQSFGEVETRRWSRDRARGSGKHRLIAVSVRFERAVLAPRDVGWQRHFTQFTEGGRDFSRFYETQAAVAFVVRRNDDRLRSRKLSVAVAKFDLRADTCAFSRAQHHPPIIGAIFFEQQDFKLSTRVGIDAAQTRRNYT